VDEFQDVDPLQEAILRLISTESAEGSGGNLFAVGDIKQSIYRFRLAEPALFSDLADAFADPQLPGRLIHLQENFRSRESIIEAVNIVFRPLMRKSFGGSEYDESARLNCGAVYPDTGGAVTFDRPGVELHLLEPVTERTRQRQGDDREDNSVDRADGFELEGIEREAFLIGRRIRQWMGEDSEGRHWQVADKAQGPGGAAKLRPIRYRDMVIMLRALPHKAEPIAEILGRMGIPVQVERDSGGMDSTEFRDVISLLGLIDNCQQDVSLAAVLRSPLLGEAFSETDLLEIRLPDRGCCFHEAVRKYAEQGSDVGLCDRLRIFLATIERYRSQIQHTPVADVIWDIYERSNYLSYVSGLPDGLRRREHLIRLHDMAREFGRFSRQGLRRFLRFVEQMIASDRGPRQSATAGANEDVVRIMTIHAAKGLEFPVVILADLQKQFNLAGVNGNVLVDRDLGLALRAADAERRIYYPTFIHQLVSRRGRLESLSEELRVLYVALTRAREHLLLVGRYSAARVDRIRAMHKGLGGGGSALPFLQMEQAGNFLDWLLPATASAPENLVHWHGGDGGDDSALFNVFTYGRAETDTWRIPQAVEIARADELAGLAELKALPGGEPIADSVAAGEVINFLSAEYRALELTSMPARVSVSELKRRWYADFDADEQSPTGPRSVTPIRPLFISPVSGDDPANRGTVTHRFLQLVDLDRPCDMDDLEGQCRELVGADFMSANDAGLVMLDAAAWFFDSELGRRIREHAGRVQREVSFVSRILPERYDSMVTARDDRDVVMVRGIVDLLLVHDSHLEILDYKTDLVDAAACASRADNYRGQIDGYASAMSDIHKLAVRRKWLVFLHPQCVIDLSADGS